MKRINHNISDLFFSRDFRDAAVMSKGVFIGWNEEKLAEHADMTLSNIKGLGVDVPTIPELIADFYERV